MITVVGMGETKNQLTLSGLEAIKQAKKLIVKTDKTETFEYFKDNNIEVETLDFIYERATDFTDLDTQIADYILQFKDIEVVYCVDGNGYDDLSCLELYNRTEIKIISGVAKGTTILKNNFYDGAVYFSAYRFLDRKINQFDLNVLTIIYEIDNDFLATDVKNKLCEFLDEEDEITYLCNGKTYNFPLYELDMQEYYDYSSKILIKPKNFTERNKYSFSDLIEIIRRLRDPDGCQWDKEQTHLSVRSNIIEEAYELVEAIDLDDIDKMIEENGDVLLQAVLQAVIGEDNEEFTTHDIINVLCEKLIKRHTHIFGSNKAENAEQALVFWEKAKAVEKGYKGLSDKLDSIPKTFSALMRAYKVQKTAKKVGFDFKNVDDAIEKIAEELEELLNAQSQNQKETEGGDLLFATVNVLRMLGIDPELALFKSIEKFEKRLLYIDKKAAEKGKKTEDLSLSEKDKFYNESKVYDAER